MTTKMEMKTTYKSTKTKKEEVGPRVKGLKKDENGRNIEASVC